MFALAWLTSLPRSLRYARRLGSDSRGRELAVFRIESAPGYRQYATWGRIPRTKPGNVWLLRVLAVSHS
jgi:hypothetical protein